MQRSVLGSSQQQMQSPTKLRDTEVDWLWKRVPMQRAAGSRASRSALSPCRARLIARRDKISGGSHFNIRSSV